MGSVMGSWAAFERDLLEQMPLILAGLLNTFQLAVIISITGFLLSIVVLMIATNSSLLSCSAKPLNWSIHTVDLIQIQNLSSHSS